MRAHTKGKSKRGAALAAAALIAVVVIGANATAVGGAGVTTAHWN